MSAIIGNVHRHSNILYEGKLLSLTPSNSISDQCLLLKMSLCCMSGEEKGTKIKKGKETNEQKPTTKLADLSNPIQNHFKHNSKDGESAGSLAI